MKYQRFTPSGCLDIGVRKCEFVAKTQILYKVKEHFEKVYVQSTQLHIFTQFLINFPS